jgi:hypothetical protein
MNKNFRKKSLDHRLASQSRGVMFSSFEKSKDAFFSIFFGASLENSPRKSQPDFFFVSHSVQRGDARQVFHKG